MTSDTVTHQDFSERRSERPDVVKPVDSDILKGDGSFIATTDKNAEYTFKKGERYETVKQGSSDIWKVAFDYKDTGIEIPNLLNFFESAFEIFNARLTC